MVEAHNQTPKNFVSRYNYAADFFPENWAWEFLRRNEEFKAEAISNLSQSPYFAETPCGAPIASLLANHSAAERWGLMYFPDPRRNSLQTNVFWSPAQHPRKLQVNIVPRKADAVDILKEKSLKHCSVFHLSDVEGTEHLYVQGQRCAVQVSCIGLSLLSLEPVEMQVRAAGFTHPQGVASWLAGLNRVFKKERHPQYAWSLQNERLRNSLVALDAHAAGLSLYQTAGLLFGEPKAARAWASGSRAVKDQVRRLRRKGVALRDDGYKKLLK